MRSQILWPIDGRDRAAFTRNVLAEENVDKVEAVEW